MIQTLLSAITAPGAGTAVKSKKNQYVPGGLFVVEGTYVGTVKLEGRVNTASPWIVLVTRTANTQGIDVVNTMPLMRANITVYTSGSITAYVLE